MNIPKQLFAYHIGWAWVTLITKASVVWPDKVRPLLSTMVPETWSFSHNYTEQTNQKTNFSKN